MIEVRTLSPDETEFVDQHNQLSRLDQPGGEYLIAWEDGVPVGHAHLDWRQDPPEMQDVFVAESHRRRGIATKLSTEAEERVRARGFDRIALHVDADAPGPRALYEKLGYREKGTPPRHVKGTIMLRGKPFAVDAVLIDMVKEL
jgi:ribosomal protein S18 acetylase RimI-like enzyme